MAMTTTTTRIENYGAELNACPTTTGEMKEVSRTIKDNLIETSEILSCSEAIIDKIMDFIWSEGSVNKAKEIDVVNMDSNIVNNMYMAKVIRDKLNIIADRLGC